MQNIGRDKSFDPSRRTLDNYFFFWPSWAGLLSFWLGNENFFGSSWTRFLFVLHLLSSRYIKLIEVILVLSVECRVKSFSIPKLYTINYTLSKDYFCNILFNEALVVGPSKPRTEALLEDVKIPFCN